MAYTRVYAQRISWENEPSINTPLNDVNLNKMDYALNQIDGTLATWDTTKANQSDLLLSVKTIDYDDETGVFIFTWQNGTTKTVDLNIEKIPVSFSMDANGVITMTTDDGTTYTADVGALIKTYTFTDSSVIDFTVTTDASGNKTVTADIVDGSITGSKLQPNYLADCQTAKTGAETAQGLSEDSAEDSEAWAVGERGGVPVPSTDPTYENNAKYWAEHTSASLVGLNDVRVTNPQDKQALTYDAESGKWINGQAADGTDAIKWSEANTSVKKNLLLNNAVSQTVNGVTFTVNSDGSVTVSGKNNSTTSPVVLAFWGTGSITLNVLDEVGLKTNTPYILTGCPSGGGANTYAIDMWIDGSSYMPDYGEGCPFIITTTLSYIRIRVAKNYEFTEPLTFYPMIRLASIEDDTYVPYIPDNTELMRYTDNAILGAKNLLPNNAVSQTVNGVTFTVNADGSITANGTATANAELTVNTGNGSAILDAKNYILNGCPNGGSGTTYKLFAKLIDNTYATDEGSGVEILSTSAITYVRIVIYNGQTVSNLTFKPMLRLATDTDDTYVPYAKTNKELTEELKVQIGNITTPIQTTEWHLHYVKKYGKVIEAVVTMKLGVNVSAWGVIAQIPEGFRPSSGQYPQVVGIKGDYTSFVNLQITPNGEVQTAAALTSGTFIRFDATYILN